jgi:hypothetical protein
MRLITLAPAVLCGIAFTVAALAQTPLFTSKAFTVFPHTVKEGKFEARAASPTKISTTYQSTYRRRTERTLTFKFAINGVDNERLPGQDHHVTVNSVNGKYTTVVFAFGHPDPPGTTPAAPGGDAYLSEDTDVKIRLDMRSVLTDFKTQGYYIDCLGEKIMAADFKGVYIAGSTYPLTWNFAALPSKPEFKLSDPEGHGIYEITLHFPKETVPGKFAGSKRMWTLKENISRYPVSASPSPIVDALYTMSLEELTMDMRSDGAFMAGEMWPGVWTRDVSYSIILSLAAIAPDASKTTLMAKVKNGRIIQDTGTGGSWPVSTDRSVWGLAAWEVFAVTGDRKWLSDAYAIMKNSADDDLASAYDSTTGLFNGESSFLDWREQTYPRWMEPKDIFASKNLGTNAVHYQSYRILATMASLLGEDGKKYSAIADGIKTGMNTLLWQPGKGYYGQYLYGRSYQSLSPRSEGLGEALTVLFGIPAAEQHDTIIARTPVTAYGIPCIYPQIPNIPPYHNDAVWPFVEAYWGWASAKTKNEESVSRSLAAVYRAAALYLTNKENLVASTGDFMGTEINSNRQLWSVAGNLAMTYRILYGMTFTPEGLSFEPFIPKAYGGVRTLKKFTYREAELSITVRGYGSAVASVTLDGKAIAHAVVPPSLKGAHSLVITMNNAFPWSRTITVKEHAVSPETPVAHITGSTLEWNAVAGAEQYAVIHNGKTIAATRVPSYAITDADRNGEFQAAAIDHDGLQSFLSEPVRADAPDAIVTISTADGANAFTRLDRTAVPSMSVQIDVPRTGTYVVDVEYANGSGPINTDNKCAIRTASIDGTKIGTIVMPQRGVNAWTEWGYSNAVETTLAQGRHTFTLTLQPSDTNMNGETNTACVRQIRLTPKR